MAKQGDEKPKPGRRKNTGYQFSDGERATIEALADSLSTKFGLTVTFQQAAEHALKKGFEALAAES